MDVKSVKVHSSTIIPKGSTFPVSETLPQAIQTIVQALHPLKIILFGSYANGSPTPDSDVDLLVIIESSLPPRERYLAVSRLLRPRPFPVDILVKTPAEIQKALNLNDPFIQEIISQGKIIYERE